MIFICALSYGQYRGEYGIEDTRQSLFEARQKGIHPYCITIDKDAGDYLPYMYGAANYVLIEDFYSTGLKIFKSAGLFCKCQKTFDVLTHCI